MSLQLETHSTIQRLSINSFGSILFKFQQFNIQSKVMISPPIFNATLTQYQFFITIDLSVKEVVLIFSFRWVIVVAIDDFPMLPTLQLQNLSLHFLYSKFLDYPRFISSWWHFDLSPNKPFKCRNLGEMEWSLCWSEEIE